MNLVGKARTSARVLARARRQRRVPYLPETELRRIQAARVRAIVAHAYRTVPHYRETMDRLGLTPVDFRSAYDLAKLLLLS